MRTDFPNETLPSSFIISTVPSVIEVMGIDIGTAKSTPCKRMGGNEMSDYKTGNSNSAYTHDPNVYRESCSDCGQRLESNETFEAYGRIYCGPCD